MVPVWPAGGRISISWPAVATVTLTAPIAAHNPALEIKAGLFAHKFLCARHGAGETTPLRPMRRDSGLIAALGGDLWPVALLAGRWPYHRAHPPEGLWGASRLLLHRCPGNLFGRRRGPPRRPEERRRQRPAPEQRRTRTRREKAREQREHRDGCPRAQPQQHERTQARGNRHGDKRKETKNSNSPVYEPAARPASLEQSVKSQ